MRVTAETKQETKQRILEAAKKQFASAGFEAATTRDIAQAAGVAAGTLFNYFATKEAIVAFLVNDAWEKGAAEFAKSAASGVACSMPPDMQPRDLLEQELFAHVSSVLRKLKPYRKYLPAVLETTLSPLRAGSAAEEAASPRGTHLEVVGQIASRHGYQAAMTSLALQLYWTLLCGLLSFWALDRSPRQEDTLALLDESLAMYVLWLASQNNEDVSNR